MFGFVETKRVKIFWIARGWVVICLLVGLLAVGCSQRTNGPVVAPHFELRDLNGKVVSSDSLKGKPTLLVFWATWCPTCKDELPTFNTLKEKGIIN